jgi:hypothetical protein
MYLLGVSSSQVSRQFSKPNPPVITSTSIINDRTVSFSWTEGTPVPNNYPVTDVIVECDPPVKNLTIFQSGKPTIINGDFLPLTSYKFTLRAINIHGTSDKSLESDALLVVARVPIGSSSTYPATSGLALAANRPTAPSGFYWIKSASMPNPLQMYVNMTQEGGGYDFYFITNGPAHSYRYQTNGGQALGLDFVMPRSKYHWIAMYEAVRDARPAGALQDYFTTAYGVWSYTAANYAAQSVIMRNPTYYGSGTSAWQVNDGGRWWLRDTTFSEPNGDYGPQGWLGGYGIADPYTGGDMGFNDLTSNYSSGNYYLVSTNAKP